jgi:transcriptional regulator with XRE-family HTH domain
MPHPVDRELLNQFGQRIRHLRTDRGLSQEQLAELTGFHRTYIGMVERGERNISLSNIGVFARTFEMSVSELMKFDSEAAKSNRGGKAGK